MECSIFLALEGYRRLSFTTLDDAIDYGEIRPTMTVRNTETIIAKSIEKHQGVSPRIVSDNDPPLIAKDVEEFIGVDGLTHVRTGPQYPQSYGKPERWHGSLKQECIGRSLPGTQDLRGG